MNRTLGAIVTVSFLAGGCSSNPPAKAPGTDPSDMSAEEHRAEAQAHDEEADEHKQMNAGKPGAGKAPHMKEAQEHRDVADQHEAAAEEAEAEEDTGE